MARGLSVKNSEEKIMLLLSFAAIALLTTKAAIAVPYGELCDSTTIICMEVNNLCAKQSACLKGRCQCVSGYVRDLNNTLCQPEKLLDDSCTTYCSVGRCINSKCQCEQGYVASSDRRQCIRDGKKLNEPCTTAADCRGGGVTCNTTCQCQTGLKAYDSYSCSYYGYGDACTPDISFCPSLNTWCSNITKTCSCDSVGGITYVYLSTEGGCVHPDSTKNVGYGETCTNNDYGKTARFCAENYVCGRCPENSATQNYECLSSNPNGVAQIRASFLAIVTVLLLGIKIFTA